MQLPTKAPGKAMEIGLKHLGSCHPCGRTGWSVRLLALPWPTSGYCGHLGPEPVDRRFSFLLPFKNKQTFLEINYHGAFQKDEPSSIRTNQVWAIQFFMLWFLSVLSCGHSAALNCWLKNVFLWKCYPNLLVLSTLGMCLYLLKQWNCKVNVPEKGPYSLFWNS